MSRATDLPRTAVPQGVAAFFPDVASRMRYIEERVLVTFRRWGYREIVPPLFEYLEVLSQGLVPETVARGYKVEDRQDGRLMVLRPDVTAQVARMAAARQEPPDTPHRYGYATNVFTHVEAHRGRPREVFQAGVELLGPGGVDADVEVLSLLITTLRNLGLTDFVVAMGQSGYFQAILEGLGLDEAGEGALTAAMQSKDAASIRTLLAQAGIDAERAALLEKVPFLIGGAEVFATARSLTQCKKALGALDHLEAVVAGLESLGFGGHCLADLGETRNLSYYTGIVFEVLVPSLGFELGGGGRYDDLVGRFGHPMNATGFALDLERVMEALNRAGVAASLPALDYVVQGDRKAAYRAAAGLREAGLRVAVGLSGEDGGVPVVTADGAKLLVNERGAPRPVEVTELVSLAAAARNAG